jgi:hypothetical protein
VPELSGRLRHPGVVGHDSADIFGQALHGCEVDRIERSQLDGAQGDRDAEHTLTDANDLTAREHVPRGLLASSALRQQSAPDFDASEGTRDEGSSPAEIPPQRVGLLLSHCKLEER